MRHRSRSAPAVSLLITVFLLQLWPVPLSANSMVAQNLVEDGIYFYEHDDYERAIHAFSKALAVDHLNAEARDYLNKMGLREGLYTAPKSQLGHIADLAKDLEGKLDRIHSLEAENQRRAQLNRLLEEDTLYLREAVRAREQENEDLMDQIDEVEHLVLSTRAEADGYRGEIDLLNEQMARMKEQIAGKIALIREKQAKADELTKMLKTAQRHAEEESASYEARMAELREEFERYRTESSKSRDAQQKYINKLEEALREKGLQIGAFKNKLISTEYKLTEREKQLVEKSKDLIALRNELGELEEQMAYLQMAEAAARPMPRPHRGRDELSGLKEQLKVSDHTLEAMDQIEWSQDVHVTERLRLLQQQVKMLNQLDRELASARRRMTALRSDLAQTRGARPASVEPRRIEEFEAADRMVQDLEREVVRRKNELKQLESDLRRRPAAPVKEDPQTAALIERQDRIVQEVQTMIREARGELDAMRVTSDLPVEPAPLSVPDIVRGYDESRAEDEDAGEEIFQAGVAPAPALKQPSAAKSETDSQAAQALSAAENANEGDNPEVEQLRKELAACKEELEAMEKSLIGETTEELSRDRVVARQKKQIAKLSDQLEVAQNEAEALRKGMNDVVRQQLPAIQERIRQQNEVMEDLRAQLEEARAELGAVNPAALAALEEARTAGDAPASDAPEEDGMAAVEDEEIPLDRIEPTPDARVDETRQHAKRVKRLEAELETSRDEAARMQGKLEELATEKLPSIKEHIKEQDGLISDLQQELAAARDKLALAQGDDEDRSDLERAYLVKEQSGVVDELDGRIRDLEQKLNNMKEIENSVAGAAEGTAPRIQDQEEEIARLRQERDAAREKLGFLREAPAWTLSVDRLKSLRDRLARIRAGLDSAFRERTENYDILEAKFLQTRERLLEAEAVLQQKNGQIDYLEEQLNGILTRFEQEEVRIN